MTASLYTQMTSKIHVHWLTQQLLTITILQPSRSYGTELESEDFVAASAFTSRVAASSIVIGLSQVSYFRKTCAQTRAILTENSRWSKADSIDLPWLQSPNACAPFQHMYSQRESFDFIYVLLDLGRRQDSFRC
jgi:hypothetical protein